MSLENLLDFEFFASNFFLIRSKSGEVKAIDLNRAQRYIHKRLQDQLEKTGKVRAVILKGRQQGCCFSEQMKVLTADYRWVKIKDIQIGDRLVACDEQSPGKISNGRNQSRKFRTAIVEDKKQFIKEVFEVILDNGARLEVTSDHRMLSKKRGGDDQVWRYISDFKIGDQMRVIARPPNYNCQSYEDGWMAGIIDGEGSSRTGKGAKRLSVHQVSGSVLKRMEAYFKTIDMPYKTVIDSRIDGINKQGRKPVHRLDIHRLPYLIELLARCRPTRFTNDEWHVGHELPGKAAQDGISPWTKVISIKPIGKMKVIDLQTSEKTFICEGLVSHNSTYIQARFSHRVISTRGMKAYILTHEAEATANLFEMTRRYIDNLPDGLCPKPDTSAANKLHFKAFDSGYAVGTAGNKGAGRSQTLQLFHGSEVAFWPHAEEHAKGVMQAIPRDAGTEIILESTANGIGNYYHNMWQTAISGDSEYQAIFVPWYWQDEYKVSLPGFECTEEEQAILDQHEKDGITLQNIIWRRLKISEFNGHDLELGTEQFKQEYPMTAAEAFRNPVADAYINANAVMRARKNEVDTDAGLIIGVDPALGEKDKFAIIRRRGRRAYKLERHTNHNTMQIAGVIRKIIEKENPVKVFIDVIGIGAGVVDRLQEMGFDIVEGINSARNASEKDKYYNKRAEMWAEMREWLNGEMAVEIPDSDVLHGDLCGLGYKWTSNGQLQIEKKDDLKKRGLPSPDTADALALTFAGGFYDISHGEMADREHATNTKGKFF